MAIRLLAFIIVLCGMLAMVELWIPLFASNDRRGRAPANLGLTALTFVLNWVLDATAAILALSVSIDGKGLLRSLAMPTAAWIAVSVVVLDLTAYLAHFTMHKTPLLWRVHRVHHSDPFVDVTTAFRQHPLEGVWRFLWTIGPIWMLGLPTSGVLVYRVLSAGNALLEHANVRISPLGDRLLAVAWVSPNMHKVHHSQEQIQTDSNYGNILSVFDRAFRTFRPTEEALLVSYGLGDISAADGKSITRLVTLPFA